MLDTIQDVLVEPEVDAIVPDFVHLHGHTLFSVLDSTSDPLELARKAIRDGQRSIAITDHGIASGWVQMSKACKKATEEAQKEERDRLTELGLPIDEEAISKIHLKFIPGVEMYETNDRRVQSKAEMDEHGYSTHHFLLLPKNNEGLVNLNRIISDASLNGQFYGRNRTDMDVIEEKGWGKNLIATSACLASRTSRLILAGKIDEAEEFALRCAGLFDEFYLELQDNKINDQYIVNEGLMEISRRTGLPLLYTQDYHYVDEHEQDLHDTWICVGRKQEKSDLTRQGYDGGPYHLATKEEMYASVLAGIIPEEAYANTVRVAEQCNVVFDFKSNRFPKYKFLPKGYTADSMLRKIAEGALNDYLVKRHEVGRTIDPIPYINRIEKELKVISDKGYSDYFLILEDITGYCHRNNIYIGPGRGSAAGSLLSYLLKITRIDPVEHDLLFERFLNPERMSAPDIDVDFQHDRREEVLQYIIDRFGKDHVAQIITYGTEKLRSGIDDLCRALVEKDKDKKITKYGPSVAEQIKKSVPFGFPDQSGVTYEKMKRLAEDPEYYRDAFRDQTDKLSKQAKEFMEHMARYPDLHTGLRFIEGLVRNYGTHAAAVVITDAPITDHVPVYKSKGIMPVTAFSMDEIDGDLHMLKLDALSLSNMTTIQQAVDNINNTRPADAELFDVNLLPLDDKETFKTIRDGHTVGVFQLSGGPITGYTKRVRPYDFNNIVDILALFRPGPLDAMVEKGVTMADKYVHNADDKALERYLESIPENVRDIYKSTRGVLTYQEQIMELSQTMAGYSMGGADLLRRAIGKKDLDLIQAVRFEFVYGTQRAIPLIEAEIAKLDPVKDKPRLDTYRSELANMNSKTEPVAGAINLGFDEEYAISTYNGIERFAGYSFNKSHSAAYGLLAYYTAYMKTHYPVEFMTALLSVEATEEDDTIKNIQECRRLAIPILPPDINKSGRGYKIEFIEAEDENGVPTGKMVKAIRYGFNSIKGIGPKVIEEILERKARSSDEDSEGEDYTDFEDFFGRVNKRTVNKGFMERLIQSGCFDYDDSNRYSIQNKYTFDLRKDKEFEGTFKEFEAGKKDKSVKAGMSYRLDPKDYDDDALGEYENDLFGFYLSYHPYQDLPYTPWHEVPGGHQVDMGGKIVKIKKIKTKKGDNMCFLTVDTAGGSFDITVFPRQFESMHAELFSGNIAIFRGKKDIGQDDRSSMLLDQILSTRKKKFKVERPEDEPVEEEVVAVKPAFVPAKKSNPLADLFN